MLQRENSVTCNFDESPYIGVILLMIESCITLRTLNYGNYGIFLILGNAGFIASTV